MNVLVNRWDYSRQRHLGVDSIDATFVFATLVKRDDRTCARAGQTNVRKKISSRKSHEGSLAKKPDESGVLRGRAPSYDFATGKHCVALSSNFPATSGASDPHCGGVVMCV